MTPESRFIFIEARAGLYRQQIESESDCDLMQDHNMAMACFEMADVLLQGCGLYSSINSLDEDWRMLVFKKAIEYRPEFERRIGRLYKSWLDASVGLMRLYDERIGMEYAQRGFDVERVAELRKSIREVQGALTDDAAFFRHEPLVQLRDEAIDACRGGDALEV